MTTAAAGPAAFVAALRARDPVGAAAVARAMVRDGADLKSQWAAVARFAATEGDWPLAVDAMRRFVRDDGGAVDRRLSLAETLAECGRADEAVAELEAARSLAPGDPRIDHFLGTLLIEGGRREEGVERLRAALGTRPRSGPSWLALANARTFTRGDPDFAALERAGSLFDGAPAAERAAWCYARGKALDDLGEHARAFDAFAQGARLVAAERPYDARVDQASALATITGWDARWAGTPPAPGGRAILVTGKPRSGTTLVEQILASHSAVADGGEVNLLGPAVQAAGGAGVAALAARVRAGADWSPLRDRYAQLLAGRFGPAGRIVDKSLNTSRFAGAVRLAMPEVPLVWLRRDPLDTAWSSFRTFFARGVAWSFDLEAMARHHAIEDRLHAFWSEQYGPRLLTLSYAELVERPDESIDRLLAHCGLPPEPGVRDFHRTERAVRTASVGQVRRPVNRDGLSTAEPYRARLAPYERAYAEARRALGL